jgi:hypothetical protein
MRRIIALAALSATLSAAMLLGTSLQGEASARSGKSHRNVGRATAMTAGCPLGDPSACPTPCRSAGASTAAAVDQRGAKAGCPVSDPSACPTPCQSAGASAAAVRVPRAAKAACPVSDPSACPAPCRTAAGATAAGATSVTTVAAASVKH